MTLPFRYPRLEGEHRRIRPQNARRPDGALGISIVETTFFGSVGMTVPANLERFCQDSRRATITVLTIAMALAWTSEAPHTVSDKRQS